MPDDDPRHARAALTALPSHTPLSDGPDRTDPVEVWARLAPHHPGIDPARLLDTASAGGWRLLIPGDPGWPAVLEDTAGAPVGLWVRGSGDLPAVTRRSVTVVGAVAGTDYGTRITRDLVWDLTTPLAAEPVTVAVGGLVGDINATALWVAVAHRRAVAVLTSVRTLTRYTRNLFADVADGGIVACLAPPGTSPALGHQVVRVRLLAALTRATVLVESGRWGAAFATARAAHRYRRPVLVVPGPVTSHLSAGPHALLRDGSARLITSAADVFAALDRS
ncbi:SMF family protein [Parafrankia soli]|uniref:SMF family protein n=1 Tax=Parafrankia soli TaxID=2599596 RepID=A0A1S1PT99_9ACTN|nr:DNA-processing protein DprA [Parafrankia soli]OHV23972.1 SMF family protein [Parafrankia soli]